MCSPFGLKSTFLVAIRFKAMDGLDLLAGLSSDFGSLDFGGAAVGAQSSDGAAVGAQSLRLAVVRRDSLQSADSPGLKHQISVSFASE